MENAKLLQRKDISYVSSLLEMEIAKEINTIKHAGDANQIYGHYSIRGNKI